jgi:hypothetical protein
MDTPCSRSQSASFCLVSTAVHFFTKRA